RWCHPLSGCPESRIWSRPPRPSSKKLAILIADVKKTIFPAIHGIRAASAMIRKSGESGPFSAFLPPIRTLGDVRTNQGPNRRLEEEALMDECTTTP
ncbi:hypothetical protein, partial [Novosphingobium sediminis]|uniref:hypothetical protein n=1 Tax=Novosphingobium sediminis TaxID=707214 RepID=UPI001C3FCBC0